MDDFTGEIIPLNSKDTLVLKPRGSIDWRSTDILENYFSSAVANAQHRIVLDLSATDYISSSGFGLFLGTVSMLRKNGGDLYFMNVPRPLADLFASLNIGYYFKSLRAVEELA